MADQPCRNPNCKSYGQPHPNCRCYGGMAQGGVVKSFCSMGRAHKPGCQYAKGGFVLESEDATHYKVKHPNGDELKIAKKGLSEKMHKQIKSFAKGGEVKNPISEGFTNATGAEGIKQATQNIKNYADGGMSTPTDPNQYQTPASQPPVTITIQNPGSTQTQQPQQAQPDQDTQQAARVLSAPAPIDKLLPKDYQQYYVDSTDKTGEFFSKMRQIPQKMWDWGNSLSDPGSKDMWETSPAPNSQPAAQNVADTQPFGNAPPLDTKKQPDSPPPSSLMPVLPSGGEAKKIQDLAQSQEARNQDLHERAMNVLHDMQNGHLDFNRMWSNKSVPNKILAGIGMALSGIGSGITKQPNLAMEMINKEIERDIDEQKANLGKKATVLDGYIKQYGSETAGSSALREDYQAAIAAKMHEFALRNQAVMMRGLSGGAGGNSAFLSFLRATGQHEMAKSVEERAVPSLGNIRPADIPVPKEDRDALASGMELNKVLGELQQISDQHPMGTFDPTTKARAGSLAVRGKTLYQELNKQGVFKESTRSFDDKSIPEDPVKFMAFMRTSPIFAETKRLNEDHLQRIIGKYWFGANPTNDQGQQLTQRTGIKARNVNLKR